MPDIRYRYGRTPRERILSRLVIDPVTGCVEWTGPRGPSGHGTVWLDGRTRRVHRVVYEMFAGPIPAGLVLDHLCRNPPCCNVAHLEPVTHKENILRGTGPPAANATKTHCPAGHPYDEANTFWRSNGARLCRICHREGIHRRRAYNRAWTRRKLDEQTDKCVTTSGPVPGVPSGLGWPMAKPPAVTSRYIRIPWST
jgi:HNH endonuclease